jgi:formylglycine-generating enzyme
MTRCGPGGSGNESCCTSPQVPGGTFYRTYPPEDNVTSDADPATVSAFRLDEYLVTVGRFRQFVAAVLPADGGAGWLPPTGSGKHTHLNGGSGLVDVGSLDGGPAYETGWVASDDGNVSPTTANLSCGAATWRSAAGSQDNLPINCVNWWEAYAFCIWDGGFLPSEAEWELAAAGGSQQRAYPWGSTDPGTANQYAIYNCNYPNPGGQSCTPAPVGTPTLGAGVWGQLDLGGEVYEWNLDWYGTYLDPCTDCANLTAATFRVNRGGDWADIASWLLATTRLRDYPQLRNQFYGFRCARSP